MAERLEHLADLLGPPFAELHLVPAVPRFETAARGLHLLNLARKRALAIEGDAALQSVDGALLGDAAHFDVIRLHRSVPRMRDFEREVAVVRENDQTLGMEVE